VHPAASAQGAVPGRRTSGKRARSAEVRAEHSRCKTTAARLPREPDLPLTTVAARTGYGSEFAFAKASKREFGLAPGGYRRRARAA
jgi:AraC-like DNA-binding protein